MVKFNILKEKRKHAKFIRMRVVQESAVNDFREELSNIDICSRLNNDLMSNPNTYYEKLKIYSMIPATKYFQKNE